MTRVFDLLERAKYKHVLFCGERIQDVYHYVRPLGRPTKDAMLSVELLSTETFQGGVIAAAMHAKEFCQVATRSGGRTYLKTRYVEASHLRKLFQTYTMLSPESLEDTSGSVHEYDAVVVMDYGHGMIDEAFLGELARAKYLAVNVQTNSENYGFNLATKYKRADYLCVDEPEARLATQNRSSDIENSLLALAGIADKVVITLGRDGAIGFSDRDGVRRISAFTEQVVDTLGAGDAFFAVSALIAQEASIDEILHIGNAAGALKAGIIGHRRSVTKDELFAELRRVSGGSGLVPANGRM